MHRDDPLRRTPEPAYATSELVQAEANRAWSQRQKTPIGWPLQQVFFSRPARLLFCPIGKVACTFFKRQVVRISDVPHKDFILESVHRLTDRFATGIQLGDYPPDVIRELMTARDISRMAVIRDPGERLLSAYLEKFVVRRALSVNIQHTRPLVAKLQARLGHAEVDIDLGISFRTFVEGVVAERQDDLDPHWRPQAHYLQQMTYDQLFAFEHIEEAVTFLEDRSGLSLPRRPENRTEFPAGPDVAGAADLLPAEIVSRGGIGRTSFLGPGLLEVISRFYEEDHILHQRALARTSGP